MIINPGDLKHKIIINSITISVDDEGFNTNTSTQREVRAKLEKLKSTDHDYRIHDITSIKTQISCVIRYTNINNNDTITLDNKTYNISDIEDIDFEKRFLRITLKSV